VGRLSRLSASKQEICFDKHVFNVVLGKLVYTSFCNSLDASQCKLLFIVLGSADVFSPLKG